MKITELIANLQRMRREYGDIEVCYHDNYDGGSLEIKEVIPCRPYKAGEWVEDETQPPYCVELN
jgi:hypothetical protein